MHKLILFLGMLCFLSIDLHSQEEIIKLNNPSFEGPPHAGTRGGGNMIKGWQDCGIVYFEGETPPDIHMGMERDSATGAVFFGVQQPASDGFTFLGFVVRDNETYETVSQRLSKSVKADQCYSFSLDLSRSNTYISPFPLSEFSRKYTQPVVLRIYGGSSYCGKRELLAESKPVANTDWQTYDFEFRPTKSHRYLTFAAFYKVPVLVPYNGNLLLDNCSDIVRIACPNEELIAAVDPAKESKEKEKPVVETKPKEKEVVAEVKETPAIPVKKPVSVINKELDRKTLRQGQTVNLKNLYFDANAIEINPKSGPALDELAEFLKANQDIRIEIGGHTNTRPPDHFCDSLSTERAKSVAQFLLDAGIPLSQIEYKGYGKRNPISNTKTKEARRRNQRVEIKVLQIGEGEE